jgi:precorrin-2 dehydrogenase/sirohydrochlorin ferrochelatase
MTKKSNALKQKTNSSKPQAEGDVVQQQLMPIFLKVSRRHCLVVGAGHAAWQKVESLVACGATVQVVAIHAIEPIQSLAKKGAIRLELRKYSPRDLDDAFLVIAATDNPRVNQAIFQAANARKLLVNTVDEPQRCDFYFSSVVRRGPLQIAISTSGESPAFARRLGKEIDAALPSNVGTWLKKLGKARRSILQGYPPSAARTQILTGLAARPISDSKSGSKYH